MTSINSLVGAFHFGSVFGFQPETSPKRTARRSCAVPEVSLKQLGSQDSAMFLVATAGLFGTDSWDRIGSS